MVAGAFSNLIIVYTYHEKVLIRIRVNSEIVSHTSDPS